MSDQKKSSTQPFPFPTSRTTDVAPAGAACPADVKPAPPPPFPFPTSHSVPAKKDADQPQELSQEELRLMADTMPGEGPGD